mgnify:CR=1 FL=1
MKWYLEQDELFAATNCTTTAQLRNCLLKNKKVFFYTREKNIFAARELFSKPVNDEINPEVKPKIEFV